MVQWTELDPGAGAMDSILEYRSRLSTVSARAEAAADEIDACFAALKDMMTGTAAEASYTLFDRNGAAQRRIANACATVASAIVVYTEEVAVIAGLAATATGDRLDARRRLNVSFLDDPSHPPSDAEYARRQAGWKDAQGDLVSADSVLVKLAQQRQLADNTLIGTVGEAISSNWSAYDRAPVDSSWYRDAANTEVWELFAEFRDGKGNHRLLLDDDPFVQMLMTSGHVNEVRDEIRAAIQSGTLDAGRGGVVDRSLGENPLVFIGDGLNIGTLGTYGNLPESFLGSYNLKYTVDEIVNGEAVVTFAANNSTTIESMSRNPLFPGQMQPVYGDLVDSQARGMYLDTEQTMVWTERIPLS